MPSARACTCHAARLRSRMRFCRNVLNARLYAERGKDEMRRQQDLAPLRARRAIPGRSPLIEPAAHSTIPPAVSLTWSVTPSTRK